MPIKPVFGKQRQKDYKFEANLGYLVTPWEAVSKTPTGKERGSKPDTFGLSLSVLCLHLAHKHERAWKRAPEDKVNFQKRENSLAHVWCLKHPAQSSSWLSCYFCDLTLESNCRVFKRVLHSSKYLFVSILYPGCCWQTSTELRGALFSPWP